jgi:ABC-type Co2+ transport system permease subunit
MESQYPDELTSIQLTNIVLIVWAVLGLFAFGLSIFCFGHSGTTSQKVFGLLLAILFGPFYILYYRFSETYCKII